jgi:flavorubredoxin
MFQVPSAAAVKVGAAMDAKIDEIGDGIVRLSVFVPDIAPPAGFTFNHFLILGDEPLLFHCGLRQMFPAVSAAVAKVIPLERLRWLSFGHFEADECGSMNEWLAAAPQAQVAHGMTGCMVSINDMATRAPRVLADGETIDLGGRRVRYIDTPHVPHGWDAGVLFEETSGTLLCGDLFTHTGQCHALTQSDIVEPAIEAENIFQYTSLSPSTAPAIRKLAGLVPRRLAVMHGSSFEGDGAAALRSLAGHYDERLRRALDNTRVAAA